MPAPKRHGFVAGLIWGGLAVVIFVPIAAAAASPLLAWRQPIYIIAGFAGVLSMALLLVQPLLVGGFLPGLTTAQRNVIHQRTGVALVVMVVIHVGALWLTSPPDVIDALTFRSPTTFSPWGVVAMWAIFGAGLIAALRRRLPLRPRTWRLVHTGLVTIIAVTSIVHALLIEGTMETTSKIALCVFVSLALIMTVIRRRSWNR